MFQEAESQVSRAQLALEDAQIEIKQVQAMVEKAGKDLDARKEDLRRTEQLHAKGSVSAEELDQARIRAIGAERDRDVARARLEEGEAASRNARWDEVEAQARLELAKGGLGDARPPMRNGKTCPSNVPRPSATSPRPR